MVISDHKNSLVPHSQNRYFKPSPPGDKVFPPVNMGATGPAWPGSRRLPRCLLRLKVRMLLDAVGFFEEMLCIYNLRSESAMVFASSLDDFVSCKAASKGIRPYTDGILSTILAHGAAR